MEKYVITEIYSLGFKVFNITIKNRNTGNKYEMTCPNNEMYKAVEIAYEFKLKIPLTENESRLLKIDWDAKKYKILDLLKTQEIMDS